MHALSTTGKLGVLVQNCLVQPNLPGGNVDAVGQLTGGYWILFNCIYALLVSCKDAGSRTSIGLGPWLNWESGTGFMAQDTVFSSQKTH